MAERPEACPVWREDLAAWAVAQIDPEREAALLVHLDTCGACRAEADDLLAVAAVVLAAEAEPSPGGPALDPSVERYEPPADLGGRITARIASERRGRLLRRGALVALAGTAAAAIVVGALVAADDSTDPLEGERYAFTVLPAGADGHAVVAPYEGESSVVELVATGLEPDTTYALWLAVPGGGRDDRVPAGTFRADDDGHVDVRLDCAMPAEEVGRVWATSPEGALVLDTKPV